MKAPFVNEVGIAFCHAKDFIDRFFKFDALVVGRHSQVFGWKLDACDCYAGLLSPSARMESLAWGANVLGSGN